MPYEEFEVRANAEAPSGRIPDELLDEVLSVLRTKVAAQDSTIGNIRSRAAGILSTAALVVALGTGVGAFTFSGTGAGVHLDGYAGGTLLAIAIAIGVLTSLIQRPRTWIFDAGTDVYGGETVQAAKRKVFLTLECGVVRNTAYFDRLFSLFNASVILLGAEVVVILADLLIHALLRS
jgi:hypothetical protein